MKTIQLFLLGVILLAGCYSASAQQTKQEGSSSITVSSEKQEIEKKIMDNGRFTFEVTGNEKVDAENYRMAKAKWSDKQPKPMIINKAEFSSMPKAKQDSILANPAKYDVR